MVKRLFPFTLKRTNIPDINGICFHISSLLSLHLAVIYYIGVSVAQSLDLCSVL